MANITYDKPNEYAGPIVKQIPYVISNGVQLYVGQILMLTSGYALKNAAGSATVSVGIAVCGGIPGSNPVMDGFTLTTLPIPMIAPGNASSAATGNANQVVVETGEVTIKRLSLTVAGTLAGTQADVGTLLYPPTANMADLQTTQTSSEKPAGRITAFYSASGGSAYYDVLWFSYEARLGM